MRVIVVAGFVLAALATTVSAQGHAQVYTVSTGTNSAGSTTVSNMRGYVEEVVLALPAGATTALVRVGATNTIGGPMVWLATNLLTATKTFYPRFDSTDAAGVALTSDPPQRFFAWGNDLKVFVSSANPTGKVWKVNIKVSDR
jgi:hypothetical protein